MKIVTYNNSFHFIFNFANKTRYFHTEHNTLRITNYREEKCSKEFLSGVLTVKTLKKNANYSFFRKEFMPGLRFASSNTVLFKSIHKSVLLPRISPLPNVSNPKLKYFAYLYVSASPFS